MLELRPITVNSKMEVVDGQHRLEAAKQLGLAIFYLIQDKNDQDIGDMVLLNTAQKQWGAEDFVKFYAYQGKKPYQDMLKISEKNSISVKEVFILCGINGGQTYNKMKKGELEKDIGSLESEIKEKLFLVNSILDLIREKTFGNKLYLNSLSIRRSLLTLMNSKMFSFEVFINKLQMGISRIHSCSRVSDYYNLFKSIYNFRNQDPIE